MTTSARRCLANSARSQAAGADPQVAAGTLDAYPHPVDIGILLVPGKVVGVADKVTELGSLSADIATAGLH